MQETKAKSSQFGDMALESTQTGFIQKLLKECKTKVIGRGLMNSIKWPASSVWVFIAQLVEHCSANVEATGLNPV